MKHWYNTIETKSVICLCCGEKFKTRLAPYWTEHTICIDCEDDITSIELENLKGEKK